MAISLFNEHPLKQPVSFSDDNTAATRTRTFQIITDNAADDESVILLDSRVPIRYAAHPLDTNFTVRNRSLERQGESFIEWLLTVEYSDAPPTEQDQENQAKQLEPNPLARPAVIEWEWLPRDVSIHRDINGTPIVTSAKRPYEAGVVVATVYDAVAIVTKNVAVVPLWFVNYQGAVNNSPFDVDGVTVATGCARMGAVKLSGWQQENGYSYRILTMPIHVRAPRDQYNSSDTVPEPWKFEVLDADTYQLVGDEIVQIFDHKTPPNPVTAPVPLNSDGTEMTPINLDSLNYKVFEVYRRYDFSNLPLT